MYMLSERLLVVLFVGLIAGWLAGQIVRGTGFGLFGDLLVDVAGASSAIGCCLRSASILAPE
jgi:uncharacterized membrane protein YeaQ/YmgE (transglycosylase-associated protein family)